MTTTAAALIAEQDALNAEWDALEADESLSLDEAGARAADITARARIVQDALRALAA